MKSFKLLQVSDNRPCRICRPPSICFYAENESISLCARQREGFDFKIPNSRWKIFSQIEDWKTTPPKKLIQFLQQNTPSLSKANITVRDFAYRLLLEKTPVNTYPQAVEFLKSRGINRIEDYGAMPLLRETRRQIARQILEQLRTLFPEFQDIWQITKIPGFWIKNNQPEFWYKSNFSQTSILIPYRTPDGKIKGLQTRTLNPQIVQKGKRYHWLSVPKLISAKANVTLHFADWHPNQTISTAIGLNTTFEEKTHRPLLITEGALKADIIQTFLENNRVFNRKVSVIGNSGAGSCLQEILQYRSNREVRLAFDQDYRTNSPVRRSLLKLIGSLKKASVPPKDLRILVWNQEFNGFDEALQNQANIKSLSIYQ